MASIEKVTSAGVANWLRHNNRTIIRDSNTDIDYDRSKNNYSLTPFIDIPRSEHFARREEIRRLEYAHYKELKEQFYCYNRKDVNTLVSVVVTLPKEIKDPETEGRFFAGVADFLCARYGNTVSITVHKDEGKHFVLKDDFGKPLLDENQKPQMEWHEGRAHLHYTFIPTVKIDHAAVAKKKNPVKAMFQYQEKISAKERINKKELLSLHPDMNRYLNDICGISCNLNSGITKAQGGNRTVKELKQSFDEKIVKELTAENVKLKNEIKEIRSAHEIRISQLEEAHKKEIATYEGRIKELIADREVEKRQSWTNTQGWSNASGWSQTERSYSWEKEF